VFKVCCCYRGLKGVTRASTAGSENSCQSRETLVSPTLLKDRLYERVVRKKPLLKEKEDRIFRVHLKASGRLLRNE